MQPRSTRLNNELRNTFVKRVIAEVMPHDSKPVLENFQKEWADKIYEETYGPYREYIDALPEWAIFESKCLYVRLGTKRKKGSGYGSYRKPGNCIRFILPQKEKLFERSDTVNYSDYGGHNDDAPCPILNDDHPIVAAYLQFQQEQKDWEIKRQELTKQLETLVNGCNTSGQLYKAWPQALNFADCFPYVAPKKGGNPDISAQELDIGVALSKVVIKQTKEN